MPLYDLPRYCTGLDRSTSSLEDDTEEKEELRAEQI